MVTAAIRSDEHELHRRPVPSDSFPGMVARATGGNEGAGAFYAVGGMTAAMW
jgi:hypothetical protein